MQRTETWYSPHDIRDVLLSSLKPAKVSKYVDKGDTDSVTTWTKASVWKQKYWNLKLSSDSKSAKATAPE